MENLSTNLERHYKATESKGTVFEFFTALSDYLQFVENEPALKALKEKELQKKQGEMDKLAEFEQKSLEELEVAKDKLLEIIKRKKLDSNLFQGGHVSIWSGNILEDFKRFEEGGMHISGFRTDNIENFLWEIAIDLSRRGIKKDLEEFLDKDSYPNNINGNYKFSPTLKLSRTQREFITQSRTVEMWGAFDELEDFRKAASEVANNTRWDLIMAKYGTGARHDLEAKDAVNVTFLAGEWAEIVKANSDMFPRHTTSRPLNRLNVPAFKRHLERTYIYLCKEVDKLPLLGEVSWWGGTSLPSYKSEEHTIYLDGRPCDIGSTSRFEQILCEHLFKMTGEWVQEWNVKQLLIPKGKSKPTKRVFKDTIDRINLKIKKELKIAGMLEYKAGVESDSAQVRVSHKLFPQLSVKE